jgi:hypothetical protein
MDSIKRAAKSYFRKARLKYNYFSCHHPKKSLQCKLFKFNNDGTITFLKSKKKRKLQKGDLRGDGKKLYWPADGA